MAEAKTYQGACHYGAVAYSVELDLATTLKCNCSICTKLGAVWAFAPRSSFTLKSGARKQGDYQFGKKALHHRFCTACGVESYAEGAMPDGTPTVGINLRCVDGVDVDKLSPKPWDGRSL
jgi:hypothetical protein